MTLEIINSKSYYSLQNNSINVIRRLTCTLRRLVEICERLTKQQTSDLSARPWHTSGFLQHCHSALLMCPYISIEYYMLQQCVQSIVMSHKIWHLYTVNFFSDCSLSQSICVFTVLYRIQEGNNHIKWNPSRRQGDIWNVKGHTFHTSEQITQTEDPNSF